MQDAVILANHLYDIYPTSYENIKAALSDYKEERFDAVKDQYPQSYISAKIMYGHVSTDRKSGMGDELGIRRLLVSLYLPIVLIFFLFFASLLDHTDLFGANP